MKCLYMKVLLYLLLWNQSVFEYGVSSAVSVLGQITVQNRRPLHQIWQPNDPEINKTEHFSTWDGSEICDLANSDLLNKSVATIQVKDDSTD